MSYSSFADNYRNPLGGTSTSMFSGFGSNRLVSGSAEFLQSNSLVAKVAFLVLVVLVFVLLITFASRLLTWLFEPSGTPTLLKGMKKGTKLLHIPQDPKKRGAITLLRSRNQRDGIEFTYSCWLFIDNLEYRKGQKKHIFHKGSETMNRRGKFKNIDNTLGLAFPNNAPGLYLHETENKLVVVMNTYEGIIEEVEIPNIPLNKWINVVIRVKHRYMDVYINGSVVTRHEFESVPKQNYGDIFVSMNGGFSGNISSLKYWNYALSGVEIADLNGSGPNLTASDDMEVFPPYLSLRWYFGS